MSLYVLLWYFCIYSFLGWVTEVAYHAVTRGNIVNRGFLNGPVCPVYGFGLCAVLLAIVRLTHTDSTRLHAAIVFFGGMLLASSVEFLAGWVLELLFHARWWDYSDQPFNLRGYICLKFSLLWGLATVFVVRIVHPAVQLGVSVLLPQRIGWPLLALLYLIYGVDLVLTVSTVRRLNRELRELEGFRRRLRGFSDNMSEIIGRQTLHTQQRLEEQQLQAALASAELRDSVEELEQKLSAYRSRAEQLRRRLSSKHWGSGRLLRAFPRLHFYNCTELIDELRTHLEEL